MHRRCSTSMNGSQTRTVWSSDPLARSLPRWSQPQRKNLIELRNLHNLFWVLNSILYQKTNIFECLTCLLIHCYTRNWRIPHVSSCKYLIRGLSGKYYPYNVLSKSCSTFLIQKSLSMYKSSSFRLCWLNPHQENITIIYKLTLIVLEHNQNTPRKVAVDFF